MGLPYKDDKCEITLQTNINLESKYLIKDNMKYVTKILQNREILLNKLCFIDNHQNEQKKYCSFKFERKCNDQKEHWSLIFTKIPENGFFFAEAIS